MKDNVLISEQPQLLQHYPQTGEYLVVFTDRPADLRLGSSYKLTIEVLGAKSTGYGVHDVKLLRATEK